MRRKKVATIAGDDFYLGTASNSAEFGADHLMLCNMLVNCGLFCTFEGAQKITAALTTEESGELDKRLKETIYRGEHAEKVAGVKHNIGKMLRDAYIAFMETECQCVS